jgi:hypothetical protein
MSEDQRAHILEHAYQLFYSDLDLCGCGNPENAYELVRDLLALAPFYEDGRWRLAESLIGTPGACHMVLGMLEHAGLLDHGTSLRGAWLTDKGHWYLAALREVQFDDLDEVGFPHDGEACTDACWRLPVAAPGA